MAITEMYVSATATGLDPGTSAGAPWTWGQMLSGLASGQRANIKAGTYTRLTAADAFTNAGTTASPMLLRGYNSAIGDLDSQAPGSDGSWTTTSWPIIQYTSGGLTIPAYCKIDQCAIDNSVNGNTLVVNNGGIISRSKVTNSIALGGSIRVISGSAATFDVMACEVGASSSNASAILVNMSHGDVIGNLLRGAANGGVIGVMVNTTVAMRMNRFRDMNNAVNANNSGTPGLAIVDGNSFRNIDGNVINNAGLVAATNNAAWGNGSTSRWYNSTTSVRRHFQNNNAIGNMGAADVNPGDWPTYGNVSLSADPFVSTTDLSPNSTSGGGLVLKSAGYIAPIDIGAIQFAPSGGGGGMLVNPGQHGGGG